MADRDVADRSPEPNEFEEFAPHLGLRLSLQQTKYTFARHPQVPSKLHAPQGARGTVYRLVPDYGASVALKVFFPPFRARVQEDSAFLRQYSRLPGLSVAERTMITPVEATAMGQAGLERAVFMPWIEGTTCFDLFVNGNLCFGTTNLVNLIDVVRLGVNFLTIIETLEEQGLAHTDLSPANVIISNPWGAVELVDIEGLYHVSRQPPVLDECGPQPYCHPSSRTIWCAEADRYASALLVAELLLLFESPFDLEYSDEGFFRRHEQTERSTSKLDEALEWLHGRCPRFAEAFERAWYSDSVQNCPRVAELRYALRSDLWTLQQQLAVPGGGLKSLRSRSWIERTVDTIPVNRAELRSLMEIAIEYAAENKPAHLLDVCLHIGRVESPHRAAEFLEELHKANRQACEDAYTLLLQDGESLNRVTRHLAAEARLNRRFARPMQLNDAPRIDTEYITCSEYHLFADDVGIQAQLIHHTGSGPRRWEAALPVVGVSALQAKLFCEWLTLRRGGRVRYRLPRLNEAMAIPGVDRELGTWCCDGVAFRLAGLPAWREAELREQLLRFQHTGTVKFISLNILQTINFDADLAGLVDLSRAPRSCLAFIRDSATELLHFHELNPRWVTTSRKLLAQELAKRKCDELLREMDDSLTRGQYTPFVDAVKRGDKRKIRSIMEDARAPSWKIAFAEVLCDSSSVADAVSKLELWRAMLTYLLSSLNAIHEIWRHTAKEPTITPNDLCVTYWAILLALYREANIAPCWEAIRVVREIK